jgi:hypothetical protein
VKPPKLWRKRRGKGGAFYGSWYATFDGTDVNLLTANAELARQRLVEALRGKRDGWKTDAELAADALEAEISPTPVEEPPPAPLNQGPPPAPPIQPDAYHPPPRALPPVPEADARAEAEATNAAAAESGGGEDPLPPPPEVSDKELALLGVEAQLWVAQQYARNKVWKGYTAPQLPPEAKAPLAEQWEKILAYANIGARLPPWVTGVVIPGVMIVVATGALGQAFAEQAAEQKKAAGVQDNPADPPPGQAAA